MDNLCHDGHRCFAEERPDAKNVNNWHWSEKNAFHWSKDKLKKLFTGIKIEDEVAQCVIVEMTKCEGDATVNNRKSKLLVFYDWVIELKWTGTLKYDYAYTEGRIEISNFSEDQSIEDIGISVYAGTEDPKSEVVRTAIQTSCFQFISQLLQEYATSLKEDFAKQLILPSTKTLQNDILECGESLEKIKLSELIKPETIESSIFETCDINTTETFKCTAQDFYIAMTRKELVQAFTQSQCVLEPVEGGKFELFDGNVQGYFTRLVPYRLIEQKWRFKTWPVGHFADVTIIINEKTDYTEVNASLIDVPKDFLDCTKEGWKRFYWDSMKRTLGLGTFLL